MPFSPEQEAYRVAFATSQVGAAFMTLEGRLAWTNPAFAALLGLSAGELEGTYPRTLIHPDDLPAFRERVAELNAPNPSVQNYDRRARHRDGRYVWLNITSTVIRDAQGANPYVLLIGKSVDERKRVEHELREGNDQLSSILDSVEDVVWSFSVPEQKMIYVNGGTRVIYQREPAEFLNRRETWLEATHPDDREAVRAIREKLQRGASEDTFRIVRPSGEVRWVHGRAWATSDSSGNHLRHDGIIRDVTEERAAGIALRESEERLKLVMASARVGVWELDLATRLGMWSDVHREITGFSTAPPDTALFEAHIHPDDRERTVREFAAIDQGRQGPCAPFRFLRPDGDTVWLEVHGMVVKDAADAGPGKLIGAIRDITTARELERTIETQRANMAMAAKMSALGEMAGGLAHEINNPIAIIHGHAGLLREIAREDRLEPGMVEAMTSTIEQTSERISKIVRSLLAFARDAERDPFQMVRVAGVVSDTLELCRARFKHHGIDIHADIDPRLEIECRPVQLSQVLLNLLNNAHDAVEGSPAPWIRLSAEDAGDQVELRVTDSGSGISPELRDKVFQPFFTTKEIGKGTGLGLSVSKGIVEAHEGTLRVDANSVNTCFSARLPKRQRP